MPGPRRTVLATGLAAAVLAGGAALAGPWAPSSPPGAGAPRIAAAARQHALPPLTQRLFEWTGVHARSAEAQRAYTIACMERQGFRYAPAPTAPPGTGADQRPKPFGLESAPPPRDDAGVPAERPPAAGGPGTGAAFGRALFGDDEKRVTAKGLRMSVSRPGNGCLAEGETKVLGDGRMRWLQLRVLLFEGQEQARVDLEADPAFRALGARWRACMKEAGFDREDPVRLLASVRGAEARATDSALAADLRCKESTDYLTTGYARLAAVQRRWLDGHPDITRDWKALLRRQDEATRAVAVPEGRPPAGHEEPAAPAGPTAPSGPAEPESQP